jgi:hypothetical protein
VQEVRVGVADEEVERQLSVDSWFVLDRWLWLS